MSAACTADGQHVHDATAPNRNAAVQYWYVERYEYDGDDDDIYNLAGKAGLTINMIFCIWHDTAAAKCPPYSTCLSECRLFEEVVLEACIIFILPR